MVSTILVITVRNRDSCPICGRAPFDRVDTVKGFKQRRSWVQQVRG